MLAHCVYSINPLFVFTVDLYFRAFGRTHFQMRIVLQDLYKLIITKRTQHFVEGIGRLNMGN